MNIAFAITKYFPHGGSQRDCLALAQILTDQGHDITIFTTEWTGERPNQITVEILPVSAKTNHTLNARFSKALRARMQRGGFAGVVGFNKLEGLDIYFVADICLAPSVKGIKAWLPRYRTLTRLEEAVFGGGSDTYHLFLTQLQSDQYAKHYGAGDHGSVVLPPLFDPAHAAPVDAAKARQDIRTEIGVDETSLLLVSVAAQIKTKGVDRVLDSLSDLPGVIFLSVGLNDGHKLGNRAGKLGLEGRVRILGQRDDIPRILCAADLMVHPARKENTGAVILESLICGTPVVCSAACGNAVFVEKSGAGLVVPEPFERHKFVRAVSDCLKPAKLSALRKSARNWQKKRKPFNGREVAAREIVRELTRRHGS